MKKLTKRHIREGSLTIEASLVLPIFIFFMLSIISLSALLLFQTRLKSAMHETLKKAVYNEISSNSVSSETISSLVLAYLGDSQLNKAPIDKDIEFDVDDNGEIIVLYARYQTKLYYDMFGLFRHELTQKSLLHNFGGYKQGLYGIDHEENEDEYVYITDESEVYHTNRECTHIMLKISPITSDALKNARNNDGSRYKSCEHCHSKTTDKNLYITPEGDKYHNSLSCSGLKRAVTRVKKSEVLDKRCCKRCGG